MPATSLKSTDLLQAVQQMGTDEFNSFLEQALRLRVPPKSARLSARESRLIDRINRGLPDDLVHRYSQLVRKRGSKGLTRSEQAELLELTNEIETLDAERAEALVALAKLRRIPVRVLMNDLGIKAAPVDG